jgi:hypothetical protein
MYNFHLSKVNEAAIEQMNRLWHTTNIYMHPKLHEYAAALTSKLPGDLKVGFKYLKHEQNLLIYYRRSSISSTVGQRPMTLQC